MTRIVFCCGLLAFSAASGVLAQEPDAKAAAQLLDDRKRLYAELEANLKAAKLDAVEENLAAIARTERSLIGYVRKAFPTNKPFETSYQDSLALTLRRLAELQLDRGECASAATNARELVALSKEAHPGDHWETADAERLAVFAERLQAMPPAQRDELAEAKTLNRRVFALEDQGQLRECLPLAERALAIRERILGPDHPDTATSLNTLAGVYDFTGDFPRAEPLYRRSLEIRERTVGKHHPHYASSLNNLGYLYERTGDFVKAEPFIKRAMEVYRETVGDKSPGYAITLANLAAIYYAQGNFEKAVPLYAEDLELTGQQFGVDHPRYAVSLTNLASAYKATGETTRAEALFSQAIDVRKRANGENQPEFAASLNNLAALYYEAGDYDKAEPLFRRALEIRAETVGDKHLQYAQSENNLAALLAARGNYDRAEPLYRDALAIRRTALGDTHPLAIQSWTNLTVLHAAQTRWDEAVQTGDRAFRALRAYVGKVAPALSDRDRLTFLKANYRETYASTLSLAAANIGHPALADRSAGWVLNGKAVAQQAMVERTLLARDAHDPAIAAAVKKLEAARGELASVTLEGAAAGAEEDHARRLTRLVEQEQALATEVARARGLSASGGRWAELGDIRKAIPSDAILVEFARVPIIDFALKGKVSYWREPRYLAWIIPAWGQGRVRLLDLGSAEDIEKDLAAFRASIASATTSINADGEPAAEAATRATLAKVAARVLCPIEPFLAKSQRWLFSLDGSLWLIPWEALPLDDGRYAVEGHAISYLTSGRDLVERQTPGKPNTGGLVIADPDFDLDAQPRRDASEAFAARTSATPLPASWPRLPGTAEEADAVMPRVEKYLGTSPSLFTGAEALESRFKTAQRPRAVVLSTHGFFLRDQVVAAAPVPAGGAGRGAGELVLLNRKPVAKLSSDPAPKPYENPLLRCGLILAGANQRDHATDPNGDDGVLTGLEIVGADLRGTALVALSACETGLGQINNGDGVAGLRQAFQLAGAHAVLASLWQIPDQETAALMTTFWDRLAARGDPADALRDAQLALIAERRKTEKAAHPYYWAAFTLTGQTTFQPRPTPAPTP